MKNCKRLYFDFDGTLYEWKERTGMQKEYLYTEWPYQELKPQLKKVIENVRRHKLFVCSVALSDEAIKGKKIALARDYQKYFPEKNQIYVESGRSKAEVVSNLLNRPLDEDDILFDDHSPNLIDWEAHGGTAIKVLNGQNGKGIKWKGKRMDLSGRLTYAKSSYIKDDEYELVNELVRSIYLQACRDYLQAKTMLQMENKEFIRLKNERIVYECKKFLLTNPYNMDISMLKSLMGIKKVTGKGV